MENRSPWGCYITFFVVLVLMTVTAVRSCRRNAESEAHKKRLAAELEQETQNSKDAFSRRNRSVWISENATDGLTADVQRRLIGTPLCLELYSVDVREEGNVLLLIGNASEPVVPLEVSLLLPERMLQFVRQKRDEGIWVAAEISNITVSYDRNDKAFPTYHATGKVLDVASPP